MAIGSAKLIDRSSSDNDRGESTYTDVYRVIATASSDTVIDVKGASGLPTAGGVYADDGAAGFRSRDTKMVSFGLGGVLYNVTYKFGPNPDNSDSSDGDSNPTNNPVQVSGGPFFEMRPMTIDLDGKSVVASNGELLDPPYEKEQPLFELQIQRNEAGDPSAKARQFTDSINSQTFRGGGPKTVLCRSVVFNNDFYTDENGAQVEYWPTTYSFLYREEKWNPTNLLDQGTFRRVADGAGLPGGATFRKFVIKDEYGQPISQPVPLDGNGGEIKNPTLANAVQLPFKFFREQSFASLNLG